MKKKLQIFVSSTYTDLKEERQAAVETILKSGNIPAGMELFTAGNESQLKTIYNWIDDSDVLLLILGGRYGSIEPKSGKSYTELEYDYAVEKEKPYFAVVISENYLNEKLKKDGKEVLEQENNDKYKTFKDRVLSSISKEFSSLDDIKLCIHESLADFREKYDFSGWIRGNLEKKFEELSDENSKLRKELEKKRENESIKKSNFEFTAKQQNEFERIYNIFENKKYKIEGEEINTNSIIAKYYNFMVTGIHERTTDKIFAMLFHYIMPDMKIYGLTEIKDYKANFNYQKFYLSELGQDYVVYIKTNKNS